VAVEDEYGAPVAAIPRDHLFETEHQLLQHGARPSRVDRVAGRHEGRKDAVRLTEMEIGEADVSDIVYIG
ncbi:MAG: hypothetical protein JSW46_05525, partial [Gemmatimonadota bacterium]